VFAFPEDDLHESETNFPSFFNDLDTEPDQTMWQIDEIDSSMDDLDNLSDLQSGLLQDQTFEAISIQDLVESDDAVLDGILNFDLSNDLDGTDEFGELPNSLEGESSAIINEILIESDLEMSSIFNAPNDFSESLSEVEYIQPIDDSVISNVDNTVFAFATISDDLESDDELLEFSAIFDSNDSTNTENTLDIDEGAVIFDAIANTEDMLSSPDSFNLIPSEIEELGTVPQIDGSIPDLSMDFSDDWLEDINDDQDSDNDVFADLGDLSVGYTSLEDTNNGFADNLLNNLMDESDDEFARLSDDSGELDELDKETDFDFSVFDSPINVTVDLARSEIDDFLSGNLNLDTNEDESVKKTPQKTDETKSDLSGKPDK
jgi:hypothetical protein